MESAGGSSRSSAPDCCDRNVGQLSPPDKVDTIDLHNAKEEAGCQGEE